MTNSLPVILDRLRLLSEEGVGALLKQDTVDAGTEFATGRKNFRKVLRTSILSWQECGLTQNPKFSLNLFAAYDLKYANTKVTDCTNIPPYPLKNLDGTFFLEKTAQVREIHSLVRGGVLPPEEANLFLCVGYAEQRNTALYWAMKNRMDYLLFLDDNEYPMVVTNTCNWVTWSGQHVLLSHLQQMMDTGAGIIHGYRCGYISLVPSIEPSSSLTKEDFRIFIEAISNDIISWQSLESLVQQGDVIYMDTAILTNDKSREVSPVNRCKSISDSNLCTNLADSARIHPFYNPSGARGEDTLLGTLLENSKVLRIPYYTFYDSFPACGHLMDDVLPVRFRPVCVDLDPATSRFCCARMGRTRYKSLLLCLTQRENYENRVEEMRHQLATTLSKLATYLNREEFPGVADELECYHQNIELHVQQFQQMIEIWHKLVSYLEIKCKVQGSSASTSNLSIADSLRNVL